MNDFVLVIRRHILVEKSMIIWCQSISRLRSKSKHPYWLQSGNSGAETQ